MNATIYVGTYKKYNNGSLAGTWLDARNYETFEEFQKACKNIHKDEREPEYMFQEFDEDLRPFVSECHVDNRLFAILNALQNEDDATVEAFFVYYQNEGLYYYDEKDADELIEEFQERFCGEWDSEKDFAIDEVIDRVEELPEFARNNFDYDSYTRTLFISEYQFLNNRFVFRRY